MPSIVVEGASRLSRPPTRQSVAPSSWFPRPDDQIEPAPDSFSVIPTLCLPRTPMRPSPSREGTTGAEIVAPEYWPNQHAAWAELCRLQLDLIPGRVATRYLIGLSRLQIDRERIPSLADINAEISRVGSWQLVRVDGYVRPEFFFQLLSERKFPCQDEVRHPDELLYTIEPDMFHDVLGHMPHLADQEMAEYYNLFGRVGRRARTVEHIACLDKIYWFTMEFGLIGTSPTTALAYGAGLATALRELQESTTTLVERVPFDIEQIISTPTDIHKPNYRLYFSPDVSTMIAAFEDWAKSEQLL